MREVSCRPVRSDEEMLTGAPRCSLMLTFRSLSTPDTGRGDVLAAGAGDGDREAGRAAVRHRVAGVGGLHRQAQRGRGLPGAHRLLAPRHPAGARGQGSRSSQKHQARVPVGGGPRGSRGACVVRSHSGKVLVEPTGRLLHGPPSLGTTTSSGRPGELPLPSGHTARASRAAATHTTPTAHCRAPGALTGVRGRGEGRGRSHFLCPPQPARGGGREAAGGWVSGVSQPLLAVSAFPLRVVGGPAGALRREEPGLSGLRWPRARAVPAA